MPDGNSRTEGLRGHIPEQGNALREHLLGYFLTSREMEIVSLLVQGRSNREIAGYCFISEQTVKDHLKHIYKKVGIHHRGALMARLLGGLHARPAERGSALLLVVFLAAMMIITTSAAVPSIIQQARREKEQELIWRGEQYARAVKLFYRKNGRFPQSLDDLTKAQNKMRFLRKEYKDPMNREDGSWRLIYVASNGQLTGSRTRANVLLQIPGGPQRAVSGPAGGLLGPGAQRPEIPTGPAAGVLAATPSGQAQSQGQVFGANLIGVGSKVDRPSIRVYKDRTIYQDWEFIWDPTSDAAVVAQPGAGAPQPGQPAARPQQDTSPTPRRP